MTNESKAKEISDLYANSNLIPTEEERIAYSCAMQMAEWKEKQIIEKACMWWENELTYPTMTQAEIDWYKTKIAEFKRAMGEK